MSDAQKSCGRRYQRCIVLSLVLFLITINVGFFITYADELREMGRARAQARGGKIDHPTPSSWDAGAFGKMFGGSEGHIDAEKTCEPVPEKTEELRPTFVSENGVMVTVAHYSSVKIWLEAFSSEQLSIITSYLPGGAQEPIQNPNLSKLARATQTTNAQHQQQPNISKLNRLKPTYQWLYQRLTEICVTSNEYQKWGFNLDVRWSRNRKSNTDILIKTFATGEKEEIHKDHDSINNDDANYKACGVALLLNNTNKEPAEPVSGGDMLFYNNPQGLSDPQSILSNKLPPGSVVTWEADRVYYSVSPVLVGQQVVLMWWVPGHRVVASVQEEE